MRCKGGRAPAWAVWAVEATEPPHPLLPRTVVSAPAHWEAVLERPLGLRVASPEVTSQAPSPATACPGDSFLVGSDVFLEFRKQRLKELTLWWS